VMKRDIGEVEKSTSGCNQQKIQLEKV
jgi:hypothetical protein